MLVSGKTALALGLAQRIASGDVPAEMGKMRVLELDLMNVVAGTRFRGDFEEHEQHYQGYRGRW